MTAGREPGAPPPDGDAEEVFRLLRSMAGRWLRGDEPITLQPTALANEAWIRLFGSGEGSWQDRTHFVKVAAAAMRTVLIDYARRRRAKKRPPPDKRLTLQDVVLAYEDHAHDLLDLHAALERLERTDPELARFAHLRFFGGATIREAAEAIGESEDRGRALWRAVKALIRADLEGF